MADSGSDGRKSGLDSLDTDSEAEGAKILALVPAALPQLEEDKRWTLLCARLPVGTSA